MFLDFSKLKILIVEDSKPIRNIIFEVLDALNFGAIDMAQNGEEGIKKFFSERHDIIITDWIMEPVDGIEFTLAIRNDAKSPNKMVPVIMLTGYNSYNRIIKARDCGVTEYLVKPFSAKDIADRIAYVVNNPRDFVYCKNFFGPDRRRKIDFTYEGPFRRFADQDIAYEKRNS